MYVLCPLFLSISIYTVCSFFLFIYCFPFLYKSFVCCPISLVPDCFHMFLLFCSFRFNIFLATMFRCSVLLIFFSFFFQYALHLCSFLCQFAPCLLFLSVSTCSFSSVIFCFIMYFATPPPLCLNVFLVLYSFLLFCVPCPLFISFSDCPFSFSTLPSFLNMSPVRCSIFTVSICLTYVASFFSFVVQTAINHCPLLIPFCSIFSQNDSWPFSSLGLRDPFPVCCSLSFRFVSFPGFAFVSDLSLSFFTQRCSIISLLVQYSPFVFKNLWLKFILVLIEFILAHNFFTYCFRTLQCI